MAGSSSNELRDPRGRLHVVAAARHRHAIVFLLVLSARIDLFGVFSSSASGVGVGATDSVERKNGDGGGGSAWDDGSSRALRVRGHSNNGEGDGNDIFRGTEGRGDYYKGNSSAPHTGCLKFLEEDHTPQKLTRVSGSGGKGAGIASRGGANAAFTGASEFVSSARAAAAAHPCTNGAAGPDGYYPCLNIDLESFLPLSDIGGGQVNDCWGWTHPPSGREFALVAKNSGTAFVEITDPAGPVYLGDLRARSANSFWRDIKTYDHFAYIVSEMQRHGMQVFDLNQLLNVADPPAIFRETSHYDDFGNAHNLFINEDTAHAYAVGTDTCSGGLHMIDIGGNPASPEFAGCYASDGYTHDVQCVLYDGPDRAYVGREVCFALNEDHIAIVDVTDKAGPVQLFRKTYDESRYTHQGWLTEDHAYLLFGDELDEKEQGDSARTRTFVLDVRDLTSLPDPVSFAGTTPATDHNQYVKGDFTYQANYRAGLRILRIDDPATASLTEVGYFDIYPGSDSANFNGAWSTYPYFPSGSVIVSGIEQGLFVLTPDRTIIPTSPPTLLPTSTPTFPPTDLPGCAALVDFDGYADGDSAGWTTISGACAAGTLAVGAPDEIVDAVTGVRTQVGGDHTTGAGKALYTAGTSNVGGGGTCTAVSPVYTVVEESNVGIWYFFGGQRDDDGGGDFGGGFLIELSTDGGTTYGTNLASYRDGSSVDAAWTHAAATVPANSEVRIRVRVADDPGNGDLVLRKSGWTSTGGWGRLLRDLRRRRRRYRRRRDDGPSSNGSIVMRAGVDDLVICPVRRSRASSLTESSPTP